MIRRKRLVRAHIEGKDFSIEGVLVSQTRRHYVLANASHLESAERTHPLDGQVWLPRERVLYLQVTG